MYVSESELDEIYGDFEEHLGRRLLEEEKELLRKLVASGGGDSLLKLEDLANRLCEGFKAIIKKQ